ncbi:MAG: hypothetical protein EBT64_01740 [Gammaproteobacteria bacterium]|jgi:predicted DNA binding CopG/RHH family protein|nr:hypothetical protein [Gammaproteobacteria bacterium]
MSTTKRSVALSLAERRILQAFETGKLSPIADQAELRKARAAARRTVIKDQRINIRLTTEDLNALQAIALAEGLPYQSLITSILHKYVTGRLIDRKRISRDRRD